ncbi:MAG: hypothetical protein AB1486_27930 [Planctomycetota bacterium]
MRAIVLISLLVLCSACTGPMPVWVEHSFANTRYDDAFRVVRDTLDRDYTISMEDPAEGRVETRWSTSSATPYTRESLRERALAWIVREGGVTVRIRVARQKTDSPSPAFSLPDDEWEDFEDDPIRARILLKAVEVVLGEFDVSDKFRERLDKRGRPGESAAEE